MFYGGTFSKLLGTKTRRECIRLRIYKVNEPIISKKPKRSYLIGVLKVVVRAYSFVMENARFSIFYYLIDTRRDVFCYSKPMASKLIKYYFFSPSSSALYNCLYIYMRVRPYFLYSFVFVRKPRTKKLSRVFVNNLSTLCFRSLDGRFSRFADRIKLSYETPVTY